MTGAPTFRRETKAFSRRLFRNLSSVAAAAALLCAVPVAGARAQDGTASYSDAQSDRGKDSYVEMCSDCHGRTLGGSAEIPALAGSGFRNRWFTDKTADLFFHYISTEMPQQDPGSLDKQTYADIMAYLLERNKYPGGAADLPSTEEELAKLTIPPRSE